MPVKSQSNKSKPRKFMIKLTLVLCRHRLTLCQWLMMFPFSGRCYISEKKALDYTFCFQNHKDV